MPELPEIEVLRRSLEPHLIGRRIERIDVRRPDLRERVSPRRLAARCRGRRIRAVRRRAKYLLLELEGPSTLVFHLGMSGRLTLVSTTAPPLDHEHVTLALDHGVELRFRDPRRFGLVLAVANGELVRDRRFAELGIEPLGEGFDGAYLRRTAAGRRAPVKSFLMDARVVVGVGNIYVSESLWRAGVHPRRSVARIGADRFDRLARAVRAVLGEAIAQGGTTLNDFTDGRGEAGYFQVSLAVYGREGAPCRRCGRPIRRIVQSGRSTFYCPGCQR